jgi:hypothetical protein
MFSYGDALYGFMNVVMMARFAMRLGFFCLTQQGMDGSKIINVCFRRITAGH